MRLRCMSTKMVGYEIRCALVQLYEAKMNLGLKSLESTNIWSLEYERHLDPLCVVDMIWVLWDISEIVNIMRTLIWTIQLMVRVNQSLFRPLFVCPFRCWSKWPVFIHSIEHIYVLLDYLFWVFNMCPTSCMVGRLWLEYGDLVVKGVNLCMLEI